MGLLEFFYSFSFSDLFLVFTIDFNLLFFPCTLIPFRLFVATKLQQEMRWFLSKRAWKVFPLFSGFYSF